MHKLFVGGRHQLIVGGRIANAVAAGVERLVTEDDGRVAGVLAKIDGKQRVIAARFGVLINASGFAHNQIMRDKYQPGTSAQWTARSGS